MIYDCCGGDGQHKVLCQGPRTGPALDGSHAFHRHLDACVRCERAPFDLCAEGRRLLARAAGGVEKSMFASDRDAMPCPNGHGPMVSFCVHVCPRCDQKRQTPGRARSLFYVMRPGGEIESCPDAGTWSVWCADHAAIRVVAKTALVDGEILVVTSFTGIDASLGSAELPMVFETAIYGGAHSGYRVFSVDAGRAMEAHIDAEQLAQRRPR